MFVRNCLLETQLSDCQKIKKLQYFEKVTQKSIYLDKGNLQHKSNSFLLVSCIIYSADILVEKEVKFKGIETYTQNLITLRHLRYWPKFLVSYQKHEDFCNAKYQRLYSTRTFTRNTQFGPALKVSKGVFDW